MTARPPRVLLISRSGGHWTASTVADVHAVILDECVNGIALVLCNHCSGTIA